MRVWSRCSRVRVSVSLIIGYVFTLYVLYSSIPQSSLEIPGSVRLDGSQTKSTEDVTADAYKLNWDHGNVFFKKVRTIPKKRTDGQVDSRKDWECAFDNKLYITDGQFLDGNRNVYVRSAFYDNRTGTPHVRVIAALNKTVSRSLKLWCHFEILQGRYKSYVASRIALYEMCENHKRMFGGWILSCVVPESVEKKPCFVSISSDVLFQTSTTRNSISIIHSSSTYPSSFSKHATFGVCVPPLYGRVTPKALVQFIELNKILGANKFIFFIKDISAETDRVLQYYKTLGVVTVLPWNIPFSGKQIWYHGQSLAINDCLYRFMAEYHYLAFMDVDEYLVPHGSLYKWRDVISEMFNTTLHDKSSRSCGFSFKSAFFDTYANRLVRSNELVPLVRLNRTLRYSRIRNKVIVQPSRVFELGIHHVSRPWPDDKKYSVISVDPEVAYIHHYRTCVPEFGINCNSRTEDTTVARKYGEQLSEQFSKTLKDLSKQSAYLH